jgi:hypothetical protein
MTFSTALDALKAGSRAARAGWNGKGMWLRLIPAGEWSIPNMPLEPGTILPLLPWIGMRTATGEFVPWLASQTDILADDWTVQP